MEPVEWTSPADVRRVWGQLNRDGLCWVRRPGSVRLARQAPQRLVETLLGAPPHATHVQEVDGSERRPGATTDADTPFHTAQHPHLPAQFQILVCVEQADSGGVSMFLDTWRILASLERLASPLFECLFETQRAIRFHNVAWCGPTISLRAGNLVCVHSGDPRAKDRVGNAFQSLLGRLPATQVKLEAGDLVIHNNHRTLHARTAFTDPRRRLIRILTWGDRPLPAPAEFVDRAARIAVDTERRACGEPLWIRKRLGFCAARYERDDLLAHHRGELVEDPQQRQLLFAAYARATGFGGRSEPISAR
jgi:hypothetical protein